MVYTFKQTNYLTFFVLFVSVSKGHCPMCKRFTSTEH